jgi:hypothetical protein
MSTPQGPTIITAPIGGEDYILVLVARQAAYVAAHPSHFSPLSPPPLEWFVRDGEAAHVVLPSSPESTGGAG